MRVVIVDDEPEIREGFVCLLEQIKPQFPELTVVAAAANGAEAMECLLAREVDLVITDIRMPAMDGLKLIEQVKARFPLVHSVIVSGYEDFGTVQQALRLGAADFLLKPLQIEELIVTLEACKERVRQTRRQSINRTWENFLGTKGDYLAVVAVDPDDTEESAAGSCADELEQRIGRLIAQQGQTMCLLQGFVKLDPGNMLIGVAANTRQEAEETIRQVTEGLFSFGAGPHALLFSAGVSAVVERGAIGLDQLAVQACSALMLRVFGQTQVRRNRYSTMQPPAIRLNLERIYAAWEVTDLQALMREVEQEVSLLFSHNSVMHVQSGIELLLLSLCKKMHEGRHAPDLYATQFISELMMKLIWSRNERDYLQKLMSGLSFLLTKLVPDKQEGRVLQLAKEYIRDNMHKPLTLVDVGHAAYVSPNYIGRLFRERMGVTFLTYLTALRMEEAKRLLRNPGIKIYEVAEMVGYGSWKHFSRTFKEVTQYNPVQYRNEVQA
ncbi:response regulator transcription factor [Paenibacillus cymbidii]|uniref:response regulator transcription factor n=1 Tax=Paenibacillus cymbidii TaxID=1639034 RepID=UPI001436AB33|nr:response regulator [Paenibacillus cymbidii]